MRVNKKQGLSWCVSKANQHLLLTCFIYMMCTVLSLLSLIREFYTV